MGHLDRRGSYTNIFKMEITTWLSLLLGVISIATPAASSEPRVVCYYTNWSVYRPGTARFNPQNINPYLCTHLIYAFGGFTKDNTLKPFDKYQDVEKGGYAKFTGLKTYNKNLKTLLAIGGWNEGSTRFSPMVASRDKRKEFVRNAIKFLRQNRFDGLDLDWEYPAFRDGGKPKDRENYARLVKELREEFEREAEKTGKPRLLLTMAVPAGIEYIQKGFDVKTLNQYLDWMNLLTYDYHSAFEPAVNHHAPLYPLEEPNEYSVDTELNIDYTIKFYLESGADANKLVLGIPTYGRSYTLFNADAVEIGSPADGPGEQGDATREKGYLAYYEICEALKPKTKKRSTSDEDSEEYSEEVEEDWTVMHPNRDAMGPVAYRGNQWVGYDDIDIVRKKGEYVAENGLGGIMFWSIDNDDFRGNCHEKPYPLIEAAKEAYIAKLGTTDTNAISTKTSKPAASKSSGSSRRRNRPKAASTTTTTTPKPVSKSTKRKSGVTSTTPSWNITPEPPTTPDPGSDFKCVDEGFFQHPRDCKKYFWCLDSGPSNLGIVAHQFTCPSGLFFNKAADSCDFARNVLCKIPASTTKAPTTKAATTVTTTTTTKKPVRLSTKSSVLFRTTTTTTTPEPESEEYEEDVSGDISDDDAEDPRVIKELIDLIKKVGGVEQLEKQLHLAEGGTSSAGSTAATSPAPFNTKLYQKVLERARGKNKFGGSNSIVELATSRRGPQNQGLEPGADKDRLLKKDRPQYTTINRQRAIPAPEPESDAEEDETEAPIQQSRSRAVEAAPSQRAGSTGKPLQYVNIRRARPTTVADTADDTASRNALFERSEPIVSVSEVNSLDIQSSRKENVPEYVTIRRQRPTTEETTTIQYQADESEVEQETALEREISSQPQYTSIIRTRGTTVSGSEEPSSSEPSYFRPRSTTLAPAEELSTPEPTTVLAVQISSLLNSPSADDEADTTVIQTTEAEATTTSTTSRPTTTSTSTTTTAAPPSSTRRTILRRRGSTTTTTTTPGPSTSTTQAQSGGKRTFLRRTKATPAPDTDVTTPSEDKPENPGKFPKRGGSKFKTKESARNETSAVRRPLGGAGARRTERPTRNFVRRRPANGPANASSTTPAPSASVLSVTSAPPAPGTTRRPFRIAARRRPGVTTTSSTTTTTTTALPTTLALESEESLQDIGDIDAIEDPSLEPRIAKRPNKTPRRPLINLKEEVKDQNPSATNDEERKRQSKKYSASIKQNQLEDLIKARSGEVTTETGTTVEDYNAETALALATHQLITAPLPVLTDYDEDTKPTRAKTTQKYKETNTEYTNTPTYNEYSTATFRTNPTTQDFIQTTIRGAYSIYDTPSLSTFYEDSKTTADFTRDRQPYTTTYQTTNYDTQKTAEDISTTDARQPTQDIDAGKVTFFVSTDTYPTATREGYTSIPSYAPRISPTTYEVPKQSGSLNRYPTTPVYQTLTDQYVPTTREYTSTPERTAAFSTQTPVAKSSRGFSSPNVITPGYSGVQRGGTKYSNPNDKPVTPTADSDGFSTSGYRSSSQDPAYFTRDYLLESPVTKTYDDEYQYLSPTTPQTSTPRKVFRKKIQRKISTTLRPTTTTPTYVPEVLTSPRPSRIPFQVTSPKAPRPFRVSLIPEETTLSAPKVSSTSEVTETVKSRGSYSGEVSESTKPSRGPARKPFEKVAKVEPNRTYRPVVNYDYYDDSAEKVALKYAEETKVILHGKGSIECLDVGNFPHPSSCKKFISCARMEFGSLLGWEYVCPKGLSFDPVGGICNWSAGLGCDEKDD